jgi:hypothetical protein
MGLLVEGRKKFSIWHFSFAIFHLPSSDKNISYERVLIASMTNGKLEMRNGKSPFLS